MLTKILSRDACAKCRICCVFDKDDLWEIPPVTDELKELIRTRYDLKVEYQELFNSNVFKINYNGENIFRCPMLGENGCILKDDKPFECRAWPFRIMEKDGKTVITVSTVCKEVSMKPVQELIGFFKEELLEKFKIAVNKNPDMVRPYIEGYPVIWEMKDE